MKYKDLTLGQVEALINKLGGMDSAMKFLRGELTTSEPERVWREEHGVIYFTVVSYGISGAQWIVRFEDMGCKITDDAKRIIDSPQFLSTQGVTTEVAIRRAVSTSIQDYKDRWGAGEKLSIEASCLLYEKMLMDDSCLNTRGLAWITNMIEPVNGDILHLRNNSLMSYNTNGYRDEYEKNFLAGGFAYKKKS